MDPLVRLTGVAKRFPNGTLALDRVDLAISRGSFVSLLGPSGCGKSTILRMIAGLVQPSAGRIDWPGLPEAARTGAHPELGFVFQEPTLMPWASVADNIRLPLKVAGVPKADADARIDEAISMVGLETCGSVWACPTCAARIYAKRAEELGQAFVDWLISPEGQRTIAGYQVNSGQLFYPNATDPSA